MQRKPFTANLIMVPSWHFGVSSTFFQVSSGRNGRKWKKPLSSSFFRMSGRNLFLPEETQPWSLSIYWTRTEPKIRMFVEQSWLVCFFDKVYLFVGQDSFVCWIKSKLENFDFRYLPFTHPPTFSIKNRNFKTLIIMNGPQHAGKTNLFRVRGGRFHAGNMLCTFKFMAARIPELVWRHWSLPRTSGQASGSITSLPSG